LRVARKDQSSLRMTLVWFTRRTQDDIVLVDIEKLEQVAFKTTKSLHRPRQWLLVSAG